MMAFILNFNYFTGLLVPKITVDWEPMRGITGIRSFGAARRVFAFMRQLYHKREEMLQDYSVAR